MKINLTVLLFFIPFALFAQIRSGKVVAVLDGDTVIVLENNKQTKIRLAEIDCPEKNQPFGNKAKQFTSDKIFSKTVSYKTAGTDKYGRTLAHIYYGTDNMNLNGELVANGLAWHYKQFSKSKELSFLESNARRKKMGIWSEKNPVEPSKWRQTKKKPFKSKNASIRITVPKKQIPNRPKKRFVKTVHINLFKN